MIFLSGSPVYMRGRFYGLQSIPSVPDEPPKNRPIIAYGDESPFSWLSSEQFTISENLTRNIKLDKIPFVDSQNFEIGWIVYIYGGNQTATSKTVIKLKIQEALNISIQTGRTFRADQTISLVLRSDSQKNMQGVVKTYNDQTGVMVLDVTSFNGTGSYPIGSIDAWDITVTGNEAISTDYMLARVNSVDITTDPQHPIINVTAYQAGGSGTYNNWSIFVQWENAVNYVRNENLSAYEASVGPSTDGLFGGIYGAIFEAFGGQSTSEFVDTSNPPYIVSNYTNRSVKGAASVMEDEYATNRPYLKRKVRSSWAMETNTETTTITYDSQGEPTYMTVTENSSSPLDVDYTFSDADFNPSDTANYTPGAGAFYVNGELVGFPTPSTYSRNNLGEGSLNYISRDFFQQNEQYYPDGPEQPPSYRPILIKVITKGIAGGSNPAKPFSDWFFWVD